MFWGGPKQNAELDHFKIPKSPVPPVDKEERARGRIALFRSLFRGREDVYARRWENDDGRNGYVPAHVKDWKAINKSRPDDRKKVAVTLSVRWPQVKA